MAKEKITKKSRKFYYDLLLLRQKKRVAKKKRLFLYIAKKMSPYNMFMKVN